MKNPPSTALLKLPLLSRVPVPTFLGNSTHTLAIDSRGGDSKIAAAISEVMATLSPAPVSIGAVLDADTVDPAKRFAEFTSTLKSVSSIDAGSKPGACVGDSPRVGVYILPDNERPGTLEDILLPCAAISYPALTGQATDFVNGVDLSLLSDSDTKNMRKPAGRKKAIAASIGSILKPGASVQVAIHQSDWMSPQTLEYPECAAFTDFLIDLLRLSDQSSTS